jgi:hypothetical protein
MLFGYGPVPDGWPSVARESSHEALRPDLCGAEARRQEIDLSESLWIPANFSTAESERST